MPRFAANLSMLYTELPFLDRFEAAARDGFTGVEYLFPYAFAAEDIAARIGRSPQQVSDLLSMAEQPASLDAPLDREAGESLLDTTVDDQATDPMGLTLSHEVVQLLESGLSEQNEREREVLAGRYGLNDMDAAASLVWAKKLKVSSGDIKVKMRGPDLVDGTGAGLRDPGAHDPATWPHTNERPHAAAPPAMSGYLPPRTETSVQQRDNG